MPFPAARERRGESPTPLQRRGAAPSAGAASDVGTRVSQAGEIRLARVESLRAVAALSVLAAHSYASAHNYPDPNAASYPHRLVFGGVFGVFLFFALTGYLLFRPFARRAFGDAGPIDLRRYAVNRVLRILPLYYVVAVTVLLLQEGGGTFGAWWRFLLGAENFTTSTAIANVNPPVWSVVVEVHFYALLPLLAWGLAKASRRSLTRAALIVAALAGASLALRLATLVPAGDPDYLWRISLPGTFLFFASGMLLALLRLGWERRRPAALDRRWWAASDVWLLAALVTWAVICTDLSLEPLMALAALLGVGACVLPLRRGRLMGVLEWRPLAVLGVASYSLYLWHLPIVNALHRGVLSGVSVPVFMLIVLVVCCSVALASYAVIEAPFLRLRRRWVPTSADARARRDHRAPPAAAAPAAGVQGETT